MCVCVCVCVCEFVNICCKVELFYFAANICKFSTLSLSIYIYIFIHICLKVPCSFFVYIFPPLFLAFYQISIDIPSTLDVTF